MQPVEDSNAQKQPAKLALTVGALGVVFGDIGTSPLYAFRECFLGGLSFPLNHANVFGILSLITWSLVVIVGIKYVLLVLRADNGGEGGVLALAHRIVPDDIESWTKKHWILVTIGVFGAALLFSDGIITPALSVLSAVEGLNVAQPEFAALTVPLTAVILTALFALQRFGTGRVGQFFGPLMLLWFTVLGFLGVYQIVQHPDVLNGLSPKYTIEFFVNHGVEGTFILGAVFLSVTGAEAMYADLGHFGRDPIHRCWFAIVFPALLLNYFGQGALLLRKPALVDNVFYHMAPTWALTPLVVLATISTIIASQAVISGVFSLTSQAVQLQYFPRVKIEHTNSDHQGQIYVPAANWSLFFGTLALVFLFRSSGGLADAYGIAVNLTMVITTFLLYFMMKDVWNLPFVVCVGTTAILLFIDLMFFASIVQKVANGGWIPLVSATLLVMVMGVWRRGRQLIEQHRPKIATKTLDEIRGPIVFLVREAAQVPMELALNKKYLFLHVTQCHRPYMGTTPRIQVCNETEHLFIECCFGFMETPDVPAIVASLDWGLGVDPENVTYVTIRETFDPDNDRGMPGLLKALFIWLCKQAAPISERFGIPEGKIVEVQPPLPL